MQFKRPGLVIPGELGQPADLPFMLPQDSQTQRLISLDSLRGLAAMVVLLHHAEKMVPWPPLAALMRLPWMQPKSAVALFFVLSGFVLHRSLCHRPASLGELGWFWWRRCWRLYPMYWLCLLVAALLFGTLPILQSGLWLHEAAGATVAAADHGDWRQWLLHASLLLPGLDSGFINPPIWTLVVEMRVALVFPLISWGLLRLPLPLSLILLAVGMLLALSGTGALALLPLFALGALCAEWARRGSGLSGPKAACVLGLGLMLYSMAGLARQRDGLELMGQLSLAGLGSALMLCSVPQLPGLVRMLEGAWLARLGRHSYAIYALHLPLLMALAWAMAQWKAAAWCFHAVGPCLVLLLAGWAHGWVELPAMRLGRLARLWLEQGRWRHG